jgi:TetR/AcrR family transcriptional regulator of autoinduction and epiphytic fitness
MQAVRSYIETLGKRGVLTIVNGERAARQFLGLIDEPLLWIRVLGRAETISAAEREAVVEDAVQMFLAHYRAKPRKGKAGS